MKPINQAHIVDCTQCGARFPCDSTTTACPECDYPVGDNE